VIDQVNQTSLADFAFAGEVADALWENIGLLRDNPQGDRLQRYLFLWALYLSLATLDVFESVVILLRARRIRAANMLSRALSDYDVRLRYYIVQGQSPLQGFKRNPQVELRHFVDQTYAARDWENAENKLVSNMSKYEPDAWPEEARASLLAAVTAPQPTHGQRFTIMCDFLKTHEADALHLLPFCRDGLSSRYQNAKAVWAMQSAYLHGDQAARTDFVEDEDAESGPTIHRKAPGDFSRTILFTSINNALEVMHSIGLVRGWALSVEKLRHRAGELWLPGQNA